MEIHGDSVVIRFQICIFDILNTAATSANANVFEL